LNSRGAGALFLAIAFLLLLAAAVAPVFGQLIPVPPEPATAGTALWDGRTVEVLLQGLIILTGVFSILLLLGPDPKGGGRT